MIFHLTKEMAEIIERAYQNNLYIEFYHGDNEYLRYAVTQYIFKIMRETTNNRYETMVSYPIEELHTTNVGNLLIHTKTGIMFEFKTKEVEG